MRRITIISLMVVVLVGSAFAHSKPTFAQPQRCFPGVAGITNCISGRFLEYWEQNGGLPVFGYPLSAARSESTAEGTFVTQYFERQRFEAHPKNAAPYDVLLGRLGAEIYERTQGDWRTLPVIAPLPNCVYFKLTQRNLCEPFYDYWRRHGLLDPTLDDYNRSLALLGLPLTEPRLERNPDGDVVMTQWFERARLEDHGLKGVLLGRLGAEIGALPDPNPAPQPPNVQAFVNAINAERSQRGLVALTINDQLNTAAQGHSDDMARNNFFSHIGSDGADIGVRIQRTGYVARTWGENIAAGYADAAAVVAAWMESDGHRANILNPDFREIGIGYSTNAQSTYKTYWVSDYAAK